MNNYIQKIKDTLLSSTKEPSSTRETPTKENRKIPRNEKKLYEDLAGSYGGEFNGDVPISRDKRVDQWTCKRFHHWKSSFNEINYGTWCPYCSSLIKKC